MIHRTRQQTTTQQTTTQQGFTFIEVLMALSILASFSVLVIGLFTIGVDRMVDRRVEARFQQVRPEIDAILQSRVDGTKEGGLPKEITAEEAVPLSRRGYSLAAKFTSSPFIFKAGSSREKSGSAEISPGFLATVELLFRGRPVKREIIPLRRSFIHYKSVVAPGDDRDK